MGPSLAAVLGLVWPVRFLPCCFLGLAWSVLGVGLIKLPHSWPFMSISPMPAKVRDYPHERLNE